MAAQAQAQTALDERVVEDSDLEQVLEDREVAKGKAGEARRKFSTLDDIARGKLEELGLNGETVRVGRFRVSEREVASRSVSFETQATTRLTIAPDKEDD